MCNSAGGVKNNMNCRIAIVEQNKPNVQLPGPGRPNVSLSCFTGRHFPEHIPPTGEKSTPTTYTVVKLMKKRRGCRETQVYCKECDMGLCAVPNFEIYQQ
ncbi:hypothetical protein TNCT_736121 [Trichonephila clavata]|uniref:Uncharacterized protein n=1 Tax=Trichonephila clavata TaxID=2740835 RepID=A0A8X6IXE8_TRICU|nr:hypothetical protein TNCT_736121 [Trichonephila clavata]